MKEDLDNLTDVERPVLVLKWVGEGKEEERVETEERLRTKRVKRRGEGGGVLAKSRGMRRNERREEGERHLLETLPSDQYRESSDQEGVGEAMGDQACSLISASFQIFCCFRFSADFT